MAIQKIMVPFLKDETGPLALSAAVTLADRFKSHIDVIYMRPPITVQQLGGGYYPIAVNYVRSTIETLNERANEEAAKLKVLYEDYCEKYEVGFYDEAEHTEDKGATAAWSDVDPATSYDFSKRGRIADLTVLGKSAGEAPQDEVELIEELVFQSGRPVLIAPSAASDFEFPETVVVAWDGGREAARAIAAALPILKEARHVIVASVGETRYGCEPPGHAASHLKLHGVHATSLSAKLGKGEDPEEAFLTLANNKDADLIVMGAYSHSRLREVIWGGFTRYLLRESEIPMLLAH
ncbi:MAG: universal stress protein [Pseudomonadota bacterium]